MSERETISETQELAVCHVCGDRFKSQEALAKHLMKQHPHDMWSDGSP